MKQISTTYKKWTVEYKVYPDIRTPQHIHALTVDRDGIPVSYISIFNKKKNLDPYMFYECSELYHNSPYWRELLGGIWGDLIIQQLVELSKAENKKK